VVSGDTYTGPVAGLTQEVILVTSDNLNISANIPNVFIRSGSGTDAIDVSGVGGSNVLDGSTGSNFLTGSSGNDTFFLDDRNPTADVFSTIVNFHSGDNATVFGVNPTDFTVTALDNQGAAGFTGLDFAFSAPGHANANIVLAGFSIADVSSGRLTVSFGTTPDVPGVPGSQYLNVHAN
jgi:Ca2+-binding RTX toxin-like protein